MFKNLRFLIPMAAVACITCSAKAASPNVLDIKENITDKSILYPESFEMDTQKRLESWYLKNYTTSDNRYATAGDVEVSDDELRRRLAQLPTVIDMPFNSIVKEYIKRYTSQSRAQVAAILGLSHYYMPIFEQALEEKGLPLELKYLPVIESGLDPNAVSRHGAAGLWQIMVATAKGLGLDVTSLVDERRDPYLSSEKAAGYLKDLYDTYGDWSLAIAAYNCGPSTVNKAIRRAGGDPKSHDFWSIYQYLSPETRGYVPMFIAANYVMTYHDKHNISPVLATRPLVTDTVAVPVRLHFNQISEVLDIPVNELRILNPQFRADIIPGTPEKPYYLILPCQQVQAYIVSEEEIKAHDADKYARREVAEPGQTNLPVQAYEPATSASVAQETPVAQPAAPESQNNQNTAVQLVTHKVTAGENINSIASQYGVTPAQIKEWNSLRRNAVRTGQQLRIFAAVPASQVTPTPEPVANQPEVQAPVAQKPQPETVKPAAPAKPAAKAKSKNSKQKNTQPKVVQHEVKSGDNLERIARKNGVTVDQLRKANPNIKGDLIRPGQKITVPSSAGSGSKKSSKSKKKH